MHNVIAQSIVDRSKVWSKGDKAMQLAYLTKNMKVGRCKDLKREVLKSRSNPTDIYCLHCSDESGIVNDKHDEHDVQEFQMIISRLRREVLDI